MNAKHEVKNIYPLTPLQEGMLYHALHSPGDSAYFEQLSYRIQGTFDERCFQESLEVLLDRHDILRTIFVHENTPQPLQVVLRKREVRMLVEDLRGLSSETQAARLKQYKEQDRVHSFSLHQHLLLRLAVFKLGNDRFEMVWSFHHILMDGWSFTVLLDELHTVYQAKRAGSVPELPPVHPFSSYVKWLGQQDGVATRAYWKEYLMGFEVQSPVPGQKEPRGQYALWSHTFSLEPSLFRAVEATAKSANVTLNVVVQTLWGVLLGNYNRVRDVVFGTPVSGRPAALPHVDRMIGLFINTVPRRVRWDSTTTIDRLMQEVMGHQLASEAHQHLSLAEVQAQTSLREGLFDHLLVFENYPVSQRLRDAFGQPGASLSVESIESFEHTHYGFMVSVEATDHLHVRLSYDAHRFHHDFVERMGGHFQELVAAWVAQPQGMVDGLRWVAAAEEQMVIQDWNATAHPYPAHLNLIALFERQVEAQPAAIALVTDSAQWTYAEMEARANQVAHHLITACGVERGDYVALQLERGPEMLFAIYGILKAGAAYVPIAVDAPQKRVRAMLEDCNARTVLRMEDVRASTHCPSTRPARSPQPADVAYLIYTSGSTGQPKGVMVQHAAIMNRLLWMDRVYPPGDLAVFMLKTAYTFDVSIWELFAWAFAGGKLYLLPPGREKEPDFLVQAVHRHAVTHIHFVPSLLQVFLEALRLQGGVEKLKSIRQVSSSGEAITLEQIRQFDALFPKDVLLLNVYGPTEASIEVSHFDCREALSRELVPIGKPIDNARLYVLDRTLAGSMPIGVSGELAIGGKGLALGYLGQPVLTQEKFRPDPFLPGERIYLTGDLAMWLPDGNIAYLGRMDQQVKIRGFRVELGEIEAVLETHPLVVQAVVVALDLEGSGAELVAYVRMGREVDMIALKVHLAEHVPVYCIPSHFVVLDAFPLNSSGKVDKKSLPRPARAVETHPRRGSVDAGLMSQLAEVWRKVLDVAYLEPASNFFDLGGHSLKAIRLSSAIHSSLGKPFSVQEVFAFPRLEDMAARLQRLDQPSLAPIPPALPARDYPLSAAQRQLWYQHQLEARPATYNIVAAWCLEGTLDAPVFEQAFEGMIARHEILRTTFHETAEGPRQRIAPTSQLRLEARKWDAGQHDLAIAAIMDMASTPFDLERLPLVRMMLCTVGDTEDILALCIHHIISDEWSFRRMVKEVLDAYNALMEGQPWVLPPLRIHYKDYAAHQAARLEAGEAQASAQYWRRRLAADFHMPLPYDFPRSTAFDYTGQTVRFELDGHHWEILNRVTKAHQGTLYLSLQALAGLVLAGMCGSEQVVVGTPVSGRGHPDVQDQIGFYLNTIVQQQRLSMKMPFAEWYGILKADHLEMMQHQEFPFEEVVKLLGVERVPGKNPLFDVLLVFQNLEMIETQPPQGLAFHPLDLPGGGSKFDLTLGFVEGKDRLYCNFEYNTGLFEPATIHLMGMGVRQVVEALGQDQKAPLGELMAAAIPRRQVEQVGDHVEFDFE